jgi:hypothetical protein
MSISKLRWRAASALITAGSAAAVVLATAGFAGAGTPAVGSARTAAAAASPGWRLVKQFGSCGTQGVQSVTATSATNAWATGDFSLSSNGGCTPTSLLIAHWDGRSWQDMRPPAGFGGDLGGAVATLSGSYAWVFASQGLSPPPSAPGFALLWQNGRWRAFRLAGGAVINSAVTFTQSSAWAFGFRDVQLSPTRVAAYAVRFNGQGWQAAPVPVVPQGTGSPAQDNIWAVGPLASAANQPFPQPYALAHWTGRWQTIPFPNLGLPSGEGLAQAWVVDDGAHGAWVAGEVRNQLPAPAGGVLLHWTGSGWVNVKLPFQTLGLGPLSHDGHGGLWIASERATCFCLEMAHYSAGRWSVTPMPVPAGGEPGVTTMRLIPRTQSVWAGGFLFGGTGGDQFSAMFKYGP